MTQFSPDSLALERYRYDLTQLVSKERFPWLVPPLARREMQLLGTSTLPMYRQYIERDAGIQRRVQEIMLLSDEKLQQKSSLPS